MQLPYTRSLIWLYLEQHPESHIKQQYDELTLTLPERDVLDEYQEQAAQLPLSPLTRRRLAKKQFDENDWTVFSKLGLGEIYLKTVNAMDKTPELAAQWAEVQRILRNPVLRIALDVGALCKVDLEELTQTLPTTMQESITQGGVLLYRKYFFDYEKLSKADWRAYLRLCATVPYAYVRYHAALTRPKKEALHLAGVPSKASFTDFLRNVMATAEYKFAHYARHNTQLSDGQARAWAKIGFDAGVRYEKFSASDVTDFSKAVQTEFDYIDTDIPTIQSEMLNQVKPPDLEVGVSGKAPTPPVLSPDPENF